MGNLYSRLSGRHRGDQAKIAHIRFLDDIARYTNLDELRPILVEEDLLDEEDLAADLGQAFNENSKKADRKEYLKWVFTDPSGRDAFQRCIAKSVACGDHNLGHDYIMTLLDQTQPKFADDSAIRQSKLVRKRMKKVMAVMVRLITPGSALYGQMVTNRLLTLEEFKKFSQYSPTDDIDKSNKKLIALLQLKGPTAHLLFMQCLFETREELPAHGELYDTILTSHDVDQDFGNLSNLNSPELPLSHLQVPEYITGKEYDERRNRFETCYHNGDWQGLYEESNKCTSSGIPEIVAIGYLELALGWIFQLNKTEVEKNLELAHGVITSRISHPAILFARHEYLHALLLRYLKQYQEASKRAEVAMMILTLYEVGEDKAFAQYCYATSFVETLAPNCSEADFQKAKKMLVAAIDYAKKAIDMEILVIYSQLQLARLYLGTTDEYLHVTSDPDRIERASRCLEELNDRLRQHELNRRFESLYYLRKSDYHRSEGQMVLAKEAAMRAEKVATNANLPIEKQAAKTRITYIEQCGSSADDHSKLAVGQKHVLLPVESSTHTSDLPPVKRNRL
jgi:hypothetical protein